MVDRPTDEWAARDERRARETLAIYAGIGIASQGHGTHGGKITADPMIPDDEHPEIREYYYEIDCLEHGPTDPTTGGAMVTGVTTRKYRIMLEEVT